MKQKNVQNIYIIHIIQKEKMHEIKIKNQEIHVIAKNKMFLH